VAISIGPPYPPSRGMKGGAPIATCKDLAPMIRARSKRVNLGGPILISKSAIEGCLAFLVDFGGTKTEPWGRHPPFSLL
jgi:hypothetical protein